MRASRSQVRGWLSRPVILPLWLFIIIVAVFIANGIEWGLEYFRNG